MPETQSAEKQSALRGMGAELRTVPAVPYKQPGQLCPPGPRLAESLPSEHGVFYANQWDNIANREGHIAPPPRRSGSNSTENGWIPARSVPAAPWRVWQWLKEQRSWTSSSLGRPGRRRHLHWVKHGEIQSSGSSITEGIGQNRVTGNLEGAPSTMPSISPTANCCPCCGT
jgi:cysteine synthase